MQYINTNLDAHMRTDVTELRFPLDAASLIDGNLIWLDHVITS